MGGEKEALPLRGLTLSQATWLAALPTVPSVDPPLTLQMDIHADTSWWDLEKSGDSPKVSPLLSDRAGTSKSLSNHAEGARSQR